MMITLKYLKFVLCTLSAIILSISPVAYGDDDNVENSYFFKETIKPNKAPDKLEVQGSSIIDEIPSTKNPWKKKKGKDSNNQTQVEPVKLDNNVIRMLPEQAMRALVDGTFLTESVKATGKREAGVEDSLADLFIAGNLQLNFFAESLYQTQKIANARLLSAYNAYRTMQRTQLDDGNFAQKEAVKSFNSCMYEKVKGGQSWITAFYNCMGEGDPGAWDGVKGVQAVHTGFVGLNSGAEDGQGNNNGDSNDLWTPKNHPVHKNGDYQIFLEKSLKQSKINNLDKENVFSVDGLLFYGTNKKYDGKSSSNNPAYSWLELFGDYFLVFADNNGSAPVAGAGHQIKNFEMQYVKPKKSFEKMYDEIHKNRFKDLGKVFDAFCKLRYEKNSSSGGLGNNMTEDDSPPNQLANTSGKVKKEIWNLTVPEKPFDNLNYVSALFRNYSEKFDTDKRNVEICKNWEEIGNNGKLSEKQKKSNVYNLLVNAENYAGYVTTSQLLHMIMGAAEYVEKISAGISDLPFDPLVMARTMISNATRFKETPIELLDVNLDEWDISDSLMNEEAAQKSGEALKVASSTGNVVTSQ